MAKIKLLSDSALSKKYSNYSRGNLILPTDKSIWLPSRCLALNWQLGGGIPYGKILELFGYESTGKSLLALDFAYSAQQLGGVVIWGDAEYSFSPYWAEQNEVDPSGMEVLTSNVIEEYADWHRDMILYHRSRLKNNEPILCVCDSIATLECEENIGADSTGSKAQMGNRAKALYRMYRERTDFYHRYGVVVIMVNQVRKKLGASMFEASETTPGGDSTRFYSSQRVGLGASKQIKGRVVKGRFKEDKAKGHKVGRNIYISIAKNKVAPPKDNIKTQVYFTDEVWGYVGYSRYHGLPEILENNGVVKKKGAYYKYKDKTIAQGIDSFIGELHDDSKMRKFMIKKSGINTISKTEERIGRLDKNLYPVKLKTDKDE